MSCKYCDGREPLLRFGDAEARIDRDTVKLFDGKSLVKYKTIDFCPICGDSLKPFGPAWTHHT